MTRETLWDVFIGLARLALLYLICLRSVPHFNLIRLGKRVVLPFNLISLFVAMTSGGLFFTGDIMENYLERDRLLTTQEITPEIENRVLDRWSDSSGVSIQNLFDSIDRILEDQRY